jgi:hypothetical protein
MREIAHGCTGRRHRKQPGCPLNVGFSSPLLQCVGVVANGCCGHIHGMAGGIQGGDHDAGIATYFNDNTPLLPVHKSHINGIYRPPSMENRRNLKVSP